jgi:hypothetical protein
MQDLDNPTPKPTVSDRLRAMADLLDTLPGGAFCSATRIDAIARWSFYGDSTEAASVVKTLTDRFGPPTMVLDTSSTRESVELVWSTPLVDLKLYCLAECVCERVETQTTVTSWVLRPVEA